MLIQSSSSYLMTCGLGAGSSFWVAGLCCISRANKMGRTLLMTLSTREASKGSGLAAVDDDAGARDPAGARRGQKRHDVGDLVGRAEAAERQLALDEGGDAGRIGLLPAFPAAA